MLTPKDLLDPTTKSGYRHVRKVGGQPSRRSWTTYYQAQDGTRTRASGSSGALWWGPRRSTAAEAAQDYCDYVNSNPSVAPTPALKRAGHTYTRPRRVMDAEERAAWGVIKDRQAQRAGRQGYVYLISDGTAFKIGYSVSPPKRVPELQTGNPRVLTLVSYFKGTEAAERRLHRKFHAHNILQEWFVAHPGILQEFKKREEHA